MPASSSNRDALLTQLRTQVARLEAVASPADEQVISTGSPALDRLLPAGGLRPGTLVEYLSPAASSGAPLLALAAARQACGCGRAFVVLDAAGVFQRKPSSPPKPSFPRRRESTQPSSPLAASSHRPALAFFYPPAAAALGIDLTTLLVLRPTNQADALWALDQALRCPAVGAAWAICDRLDVRDFRRLQLAAESGGTLGLLLRSNRRRGQPTWADVQWDVEPAAHRSRRTAPAAALPRAGPWVRGPTIRPSLQLHVELLRCRGGAGGQALDLELHETDGTWHEVHHHATHPLPAPFQLAHSKAARLA